MKTTTYNDSKTNVSAWNTIISSDLRSNLDWATNTIDLIMIMIQCP